MNQELANLTEGGERTSLWHYTYGIEPFSPLTTDISTDVLIVGGGIAGMTTAYLLGKAGRKVVVLEDGLIGSGETGRTTAHLTNAIDDRYYKLQSKFSKEELRIAQESQTKAIDMIEQTVRELNIDCDFKRVDGYLFVDQGESDEELRKEKDAAHSAGLPDVVLLDRVPNRAFKSGACIRFGQQGQFHPLKYLDALTQAVIKLGGKIYTNTHAQSFESAGKAAENNPVIVKTRDNWCVSANACVVATDTPINDRVHMHSKQAPYRTYAIGCEIKKGSFPYMLLWDTEDPYHYVRIQPNGEKDMLIVGGEDHKTGQKDSDGREASERRFSALEQWTHEHVTIPFAVTCRWSGQVMEPVDGLAYLGKNPQDDTNTYIITGDSGMGMTNTTAGAIIVSDLILGRDHPWAKLYDPSRKSISATAEFLKENADVVRDLVEYFTPGEVADVSEIPNASGAILRKGLQKLAVYRDESGSLHTHSAKCTHLGCVVHWNPVEASWDCPCHGSRFTPKGEVMNGPAVSPLEPAELEVKEHSHH